MEKINTFATIVDGKVKILEIDELYILTGPDRIKRTCLYSVSNRWYKVSTPGHYTTKEVIAWCKANFNYGAVRSDLVSVAIELVTDEFCTHVKKVCHEQDLVLTTRQNHHYEHLVRVDGSLVTHICGLRYRGYIYPSGGNWRYDGRWITVHWIPYSDINMKEVGMKHFSAPEVFQLASTYFTTNS